MLSKIISAVIGSTITIVLSYYLNMLLKKWTKKYKVKTYKKTFIEVYIKELKSTIKNTNLNNAKFDEIIKMYLNNCVNRLAYFKENELPNISENYKYEISRLTEFTLSLFKLLTDEFNTSQFKDQLPTPEEDIIKENMQKKDLCENIISYWEKNVIKYIKFKIDSYPSRFHK